MTKTNIHISANYNSNWHYNNDVYFIGYLFDEKDNFIEKQSGCKYFEDCTSFIDFNSRIKNANGVYSVIIQKSNNLYIASDKSRFFPIFYYQAENQLIISDDFHGLIKDVSSPCIDNFAKALYLNSCFTAGDTTLIQGIKQIQAGEAVLFTDSKKSGSYFIPLLKINSELRNSTLSQIKKALKQTGERLSKSLKNKQVLLPLSGGYDSRLIACWLKLNGIENVTCFTFGRKDAQEIEISKNVASKLGYNWHYIEYNKRLVENFIEKEEFKQYYKDLSRGTSMFFMQEYFAVKALKEKGIIQDGFIAIPGHSGDLLGGSQLFKVIPPKDKIKNIEKIIFKKIFNKNKIERKHKERLIRLIKNQLILFSENYTDSKDYTLFEEWLIREKLAKYNINSSHAFTFFGGEIRLPFWDNDNVSNWLTYPLKDRLFNKEYNNILEVEYFRPLGVDFETKFQASKKDLYIFRLKGFLKSFLPVSLKNKFNKKNDWVLYDEITSAFKEELHRNKQATFDNGSFFLYRILYWYLYKLKKEID